MKNTSNYEKIYKEYCHLIGSLVEFTHERTNEKVIGLIKDIIEHKSWYEAPTYCCFDIEFYKQNVLHPNFKPTVTQVLHGAGFRILP